MKRVYYFSSNRAKRLAMFTNMKVKFPTYSDVLGFLPAERDSVILICDSFIAVDALIESCKTSMESLIEWRDMVYEDETVKGDAPPPPTFADFTAPEGMYCGLFDQFRKYVDRMKASSGYTLPIGEDLMIVGSEEPPVPESISPALAIEAKPNYTLKFVGKMKGMNAVRIEYQKKGGSGFQMVGILTSLAGEIQIAPTVDGSPETGMIRAIYLKKNEPFGDYSPNYPVTVAE